MKKSLLFTLAAGLFLGMAVIAQAQTPDLPIKWEGKGTAQYIVDNEFKSIDLESKIEVDASGAVTGKLYNGDGEATIKRFFYGESIDGARQVIIVYLYKSDDSTYLVISQGRILDNSLFYSELLIKPFDEKGNVEKELELDNNTATEIYPDYMPAGLKSALKACKPLGCFSVKGSYVKD